MKHCIIVFIYLLTALSVQAQREDSVKSSTTEKMLYVGVGLSNISYMLIHDRDKRISGSIEPLIVPHIGYQFSKRLNVQVGIGYEKDREDFGAEYYENEDDTELTFRNEYNTTWGIAVPVTVQFTPFNPNRRLQFYATARLVPVFGSTEIRVIKRHAGATTILSEGEASGLNAFFIGGVLLKYKINNRFDTYVEGNLLYKDLRRNSNYANSRPMSLGLGLDYKF